MLSRTSQLAGACAVIVAYFLAFTYDGLGMSFSNDDLMNIQFLHGWGERPIVSLIAHSLLVVTPVYRPLGGVVYRVLFAAFGLDPLPYRIFCFALLLANLGLAYRLFAALSGRRVTALFALLAFSFHTCLAELYFETSTLYDMLCFTFGVAALIVYIGTRQAGRPVAGWTLAAFLALYALALDSKEMAITWPLIVVLYELVFHSHRGQLLLRAIPPALAAALAAVYAIAKVAVPNVMSINSLYTPRLAPLFVIEQLRHYYSLLLWDAPVTLGWLAASLGALFGIAAALRSKPMLFGWLFANVALLPVCVIPGRSGFVWYVPYLGWALYVGAALTLFAARLNQWSAKRLAAPPVVVHAALFLLIAVGLAFAQRGPAKNFAAPYQLEQRRVQLLLAFARSALPALPTSARILLAEDTFEPVDWRPLFLFRLAYRDASIWVDRPSHTADPVDPNDLSVYDAIIYAKQQPYRVVTPPPAQPLEPATIHVSPRIVHRGERLHFSAESYPNCPVDVEYRLLDDGLKRIGLARNWCSLDGAGQCEIPIPADAEPSRAEIRRMRFCHRQWLPAVASFQIQGP